MDKALLSLLINNIFKKKLSVFIILIWPYIFLFPISFGFLAMGNDFDLIYFSYKRYIAEMLSVGVLPLWSPVDGAGFSLVFNPFAQYFYLPSWILYLIHFITKNLSLHIFLLYSIFAISIFSLGIFNWLKSLKVAHSIAFLSALLIACSLKLTELLRFPNAVHAAAWIPWALYGINEMIINKKKSFLIIFFSNLFILTAGYPYFIVYSLFLFIPYIIFIPFLFNDQNTMRLNYKILQFYISIFLSFFLSYLIALPWLLKVRTLIASLVDRTENNWEFATEHSFFWKDTVGSWMFPPASSTEGWYYFGIIVTIIIFFGISLILYNPKKLNNFEKKIFLYSLIFILFITYFSWGVNSNLFIWSWNNIPLIGSLRTWPRINIIIIPFIIVLFSISLKYLRIYIQENNKDDLNKIIKIFIGIFIFIISTQLIFYFFEFQNEEYWKVWQKKRFDAAINYLPIFIGAVLKSYNGIIYLLFTVTSTIFIITIILKKIKKNFNLIYISILFFVALELFILSNIQWAIPEWKTKIYKIENPLDKLQDGFTSSRIIDTVKGNEYFRDNRSFNVNYPDNYGYNAHAKNFSNYFKRYGGKKKGSVSANDIELVKFFYGVSRDSKRIFLSKSLNHNNIISFINDSIKFEKINNTKINILIEKYDGNKLQLEIYSKNEGWLSYIDNWDYGWIAIVNGEKAQISKLLGSYKSIKIKKGFSKVKFQYKPW
tara:strand:- start:1673 stop:3814 length:2142 start_codon:yes stop_codon:yes gene_type:complete